MTDRMRRRLGLAFFACAMSCVPAVAVAQPDGSAAVIPVTIIDVGLGTMAGGVFTTVVYLFHHWFVGALRHKLLASLVGWGLPPVVNSLALVIVAIHFLDVSGSGEAIVNGSGETIVFVWVATASGIQLAYTIGTVYLMRDSNRSSAAEDVDVSSGRIVVGLVGLPFTLGGGLVMAYGIKRLLTTGFSTPVVILLLMSLAMTLAGLAMVVAAFSGFAEGEG